MIHLVNAKFASAPMVKSLKCDDVSPLLMTSLTHKVPPGPPVPEQQPSPSQPPMPSQMPDVPPRSPGPAPTTVPAPTNLEPPEATLPNAPPVPHAPPPFADLLGPIPDVNFGNKIHPSASSLWLAARGLGICITVNDIDNKSKFL